MIKKYFKKILKQPSTYKGLALLGSAAATAGGMTELLNVKVTGDDIQIGGILGTFGVIAIGAWETLRNEIK